MSDRRREREMGVSHADFFRLLPRAMGDIPYSIDGLVVRAQIDSGEIEINLGPEQVRRIALLAIPYCHVGFRYSNLSEEQIESFDAAFYLAFQRGGG